MTRFKKIAEVIKPKTRVASDLGFPPGAFPKGDEAQALAHVPPGMGTFTPQKCAALLLNDVARTVPWECEQPLRAARQAGAPAVRR